MSKQYADINPDRVMVSRTSQEMRIHSQRPGKTNEDGSIQYFTEQAHQKETDINLIIKKYDKTGLIDNISRFEGTYGDQTGMEYKQAKDMVLGAQQQFNSLPVEIKKRFDQNPEKLLTFMEHEENRDEAIKLGLIKETWTPETDGMGEHIEYGKNIKEED